MQNRLMAEKSFSHSIPLLITILIIGILSGAEVDLFIPSFPELKKIFNLSPFLVQLTLTANFMAYCVCALFAGTLGDRFNRRTVMLGSLWIFVVGSLCCVFAKHFIWLILGRCLQGAGMAGPAVLGYVLVTDYYPKEKQAGMMGLLNGLVTFAMAFAPVVGSYVNKFFTWQGNFVILLSLGMACLIATFLCVPNRQGNPTVSFSLKAYTQLLKSRTLMYYILGLCFISIPYWLFIGMSPLLYMEAMEVDLTKFGYYQGAIAGIFSLVSLLSSRLLAKIGLGSALLWGNILCFISVLLMLFVGMLNILNPVLITSLMMIFAIAMVFPVNILYPRSLNILEDAKSRTAALISSLRWILISACLQLISYFYVGDFFLISLTNIIVVSIYIAFMYYATRSDTALHVV